MNRTGLFIALGLALAIGLLFGLYPELDLWLAAPFFDPKTSTFPLKFNDLAVFGRAATMVVWWSLALVPIVALIVKFIRPTRPLLIPGRAVLFLLVTLMVAPGLLSNLAFKGNWGRPRPILVKEFHSKYDFVPWWDPRGQCPANCSFFSGESATAFWTFAPAALTPPAWRPLAYGAVIVFGVVTSVLRMAFGGHFFTDVAAGGLVSFLVVWLAHGYIYRWRRTRLTDREVDAAVTRLAWPGYRLAEKWRGRDAGPRPVLALEQDNNPRI